MDLTLARRYAGEDRTQADHAERLNKLLQIIEKRRNKSLNRVSDNDVDSGIESSPGIEAKTTDDKVTTEDERLLLIGGHTFENTKKVVSTLPKWLAQPSVISTDLTDRSCKVKKFKILDETIRNNLKENGIKFLFPVQYKVIPWLLRKQCPTKPSVIYSAPRDLCVSAPTGSGKTLTYVLPIVHSLKNRLVPKIRALVVVPVQELALQVADVFKKYAKGTNLKIEVTTGGKPNFLSEQHKLVRKISGVESIFESKVDILVTTPGRLVEHINHTEGFDVSHLKYLVIDEADRIMDNVQDDWMHILTKRLHPSNRQASVVCVRSLKNRRQPQKLLFSATLSHDPEKLKQLGLYQPILFTSVAKDVKIEEGKSENYIGKYSTPKELEEFYVSVPTKMKPLVLCSLVDKGWKKVLCFAKSVEDAHRLCTLFNLLMPSKTVKELSSKLTRKERERTLSEFAQGEMDVLVCSDVMARGVDIPGVAYVISYDPPKLVEGYVHRVGRTGRAGAHGTAVTFLDPDKQMTTFFDKLQQVNKTDVSEMSIPKDEYLLRMGDYKKALVNLKSIMEAESNDQTKSLKRRKNNEKKPAPKRRKNK